VKKRLKVAVLMSLDTTYKYDIVRGIIQFAKQHNEWALFGQNQILHNLTDLRKWKGDGIVTHLTSKREAAKLTSLGLPIVDVCGMLPLEHNQVIQYTNDDFLTGTNVAQHFMKEGFAEFGFVGVKQRTWSIERKKGFSSALPPSHPGPITFEQTSDYWKKSKPQKDLVQWLKKRPPAPLAIMAADDQIGAVIVEACHLAKIHIPNDVSVIGTNNDVVVCEFCNPPLSSIPLNCLQIGLHASASLHELMTTRKNETVHESKMFPPLPIVIRDSISCESTNNSAVRAAINFIQQSKGSVLTVSDVVKHCKVGRRTLEINFKRVCGRGIYEEICHQKVQRACVLLQRSSFSITEVAYNSGFNSYQRFHSFFTKYMHTTPKQYRQKYRLSSQLS
jgi:LacI family transcriptional regulator